MILLLFLSGWFCGLLVNYLSDVLPLRRQLTAPICTGCGEKLSLTQYLVWPRRCPHCGRARLRSWIVEALFAIIPVWLWHSPAQGIPFWVSLILFVYFGVVIVIDLEHRLILHSVSLVGAVIGILCGVVIHGWKATLLGGLSGLGIMLALYLFGWLFLKVIIRRKEGDERASLEDEEALGFGDVTLNTVLGFIVGWPLNVFAIGIAILAGGLVSLLYLVFKLLTGEYRSFMAVPYGPFLVSGAVIVLYFWKPLLAIL